MDLPYNSKSADSILAYAQKLVNQTLRQVCDVRSIENNQKGKGYFGNTLEEFYFFYKPNSNSEPDFPEAGLELKSTPLKVLQNREIRSKERLVLNIINYDDIVHQQFETGSFWKKNANLLLVCYQYQVDSDLLDYLIQLVDVWTFPAIDLEVIRRDWELIKDKVSSGRAHELSEGDTFYLGACTKGKNAESTRTQPFSEVRAKQRAFSLKQGYVNHIIASISGEKTEVFGKLIPAASEARDKTVEDIVMPLFESHYGRTEAEIISEFDVTINRKAKNYLANFTNCILGIGLNKKIEEFDKAGIVVRSIRVEPDNRILESVSFAKFDFMALVEEDWDDSAFKEILERKFLFIFFKKESKGRVLIKAKFWNMPYNDIVEAERVWAHTKALVKKGKIVRSLNAKGRRKTNFMGKSENRVSHVRPHARNSADVSPLPAPDEFTGLTTYTKHCFWLNNSYIRDKILLK